MRFLLALALASSTGCYHYVFEQRQPNPGEATVRHEIREPTWVNGLVGTGRVDTTQVCAGSTPLRTELQVRGTDVLLSIVTLLVYTPHTLYVTCGGPATATATARSR